MAKRIHDLTSAGSVQDTMQLETDIGGVTSNKVTAIQVKNYTLANISVSINGDIIPITYSPSNYSPSNAELGKHLEAIDTKLGDILNTLENVLELNL